VVRVAWQDVHDCFFGLNVLNFLGEDVELGETQPAFAKAQPKFRCLSSRWVSILRRDFLDVDQVKVIRYHVGIILGKTHTSFCCFFPFAFQGCLEERRAWENEGIMGSELLLCL
jgi:hypothetical protein